MPAKNEDLNELDAHRGESITWPTTQTTSPVPSAPRDFRDLLLALTGLDLRCCARCGALAVVRRPLACTELHAHVLRPPAPDTSRGPGSLRPSCARLLRSPDYPRPPACHRTRFVPCEARPAYERAFAAQLAVYTGKAPTG